MAKFDPDGNLIWAKRKANAQPNSIFGTEFAFFKMVERNGIITGYGNARADTLRIDTVTTYNYNFSQSILASFDTSLTALWIKPFAGTPEIPSFDYIQDKWGNNYITSTFRNFTVFGNDTIYSINSNAFDAFLCKFDSSGRFIWVKQLFCDSSISPMEFRIDEKDGALLREF
ncbi:MAG: hypothetical protein IPQ03_05910 [Bacteroidetes bacterium]|nr:hypothetical protein [Bacteroidota bacterium]